MKRIIIALSFIIFCTQHILFSMDLPTTTIQQTNTGLSEDQIIAQIDKAINEKYSLSKFLLDLFVSLSPEQMLDIIQIAQTHYPHITESAIKKLEDNNNFFRQSMDYFIEKASQNLKKITANNIKIIENPKNPQPTDALDKIPLSIRPYVMNEAVKAAQLFSNFNYDIVLKGEHSHNIVAFDICPSTHQAITSSFNENGHRVGKWDSQLILSDLKTGKPIYTLDDNDPIFIITFSPNGSQIAGAMYMENAIKVWCTKTKQLLHKLSSSQAITSLSFSHPTGFLLTSRYHNPMVGPMQDQWSLIPSGTKAGELINSSHCFGGRETKSQFSSDPYCASHPCTYLTTPPTELHITKTSCAPLYLCMQAIHQSGDRSHIRKLIEGSISFYSLTDIERKKYILK